MVGVQIGEYHTWKDWELYLQKIELSEPVKKEYKVSVPSGNGSIDLSDTLTGGEPRFENRTLKMTVEVITEQYGVMFQKASETANKIHGRKEKITLDDDKGFYYFGTCKVEFDRLNPMITSFSITADVDPYKYEQFSSAEKWEWDSFNFCSGVIRELVDIEITEDDQQIFIAAGNTGIPPVFWVQEITQDPLQVEFNGKTYQLKEGRNRFPQIRVGREDVTLKFQGRGTLTIEYRGGSL